MTKIRAFIIDAGGDEATYYSLALRLKPEGFDIHRVIGVAGHTMPDSICIQLSGDQGSIRNKETMGRMLSHLLAWEYIRHLDVSFALVLEDNILAVEPEQLNNFAVPSEFDLIFFDTRFANVGQYGSVELQNGSTLSVSKLGKDTIGANAYLISPNGAGTLVRYFQQDLYAGDIDLRLFAYCTDASLRHNGQEGSLSDEFIADSGLIGRRKPLLGYVCRYSLFSRQTLASDKVRFNGRMARSIVPHRSSSFLSHVF